MIKTILLASVLAFSIAPLAMANSFSISGGNFAGAASMSGAQANIPLGSGTVVDGGSSVTAYGTNTSGAFANFSLGTPNAQATSTSYGTVSATGDEPMNISGSSAYGQGTSEAFTGFSGSLNLSGFSMP